MKKNIPMVLLLITPYVLLGIVWKQGLTDVVPAAWGLACLLIFLPNMAYAFLLLRMGYSEKQLLFWNMLLKLCNIPIYGLVFLMGVLMGVFAIPILIFLVLFDYSLLLPSTMFGLSGLLKAYEVRRISVATLVVHIIMQFMFCLDVCSSVYLYLSLRKDK